MVVAQARLRPHALAIISSDHHQPSKLTFQELADGSMAVADQLHSAQLAPGDSVLVLVPMSPELYVILMGIFRAGLVAMILDPSAGLEHVKQGCELNPPAAFIGVCKAHSLRLLVRHVRKIPRKFSVRTKLPGARLLETRSTRSGNVSNRAPLELPEEAPALVTFTSGSTGAPKAVVRSHGFLQAQHRVLEKSIQLVPGEVDLATLPVFVLANLGSGVTSVIPAGDISRPGHIDPGPIVNQMRTHSVTRTAASPAFLERLLHSEMSGSSLRSIYTGGAPVFPSLLRALQRQFPHSDPTAVYGSTEAEPIAHVSLSEIAEPDFARMQQGGGLLAGRPVPEIALRIIADRCNEPLGPLASGEFDALQLPTGQVGEVVVSGGHVVRGYLRGRGNAATKISVGTEVWHRTGDGGCLDAAGRLWLYGRCSGKIIDARGLLYPFCAECVAMEYAWVKRAGCVAVAQQRALGLEVRSRPNTDQLNALQADLAWAHIDVIKIFDALPVDRRHNAKIDYIRLRQMFSVAAA